MKSNRIDRPLPDGLRQAARACVEECDLNRKVELTQRTIDAWRGGNLRLETTVESGGTDDGAPRDVTPGLPAGLLLTSPTKVRRRGFGTSSGRAAFVHAIAHIEWNAINLAWDAVWRFDAMPHEYYDDWSRVAAEEAGHFSMLRKRLVELGSDYGRMPAHAGLWETAEQTRGHLLARMALVPRVLEARGLDVTPGLIEKLRRSGDEATASILEIILRDEVGHVRIGSRWFHALCEQRGLAPAAAFEAAVRAHFRGRTRAVVDPLPRQLRIEAGFREDELEALARLAREA